MENLSEEAQEQFKECLRPLVTVCVRNNMPLQTAVTLFLTSIIAATATERVDAPRLKKTLKDCVDRTIKIYIENYELYEQA